MKTKKTIAMTLVAVMSLAAMPVLSANAESAYALGDVDMDGVITGHDTAMVSRHIFDDSYTLTDEEMALADVNQDGVVDKLDNEQIHANEVYMIGEINGDKCDVRAAYNILLASSYLSSGYEFEQGNGVAECTFSFGSSMANECAIDEVARNLMDANADGEITIEDAAAILISCSCASADLEFGHYFAEGRYDLFPEGYVVTTYDKPNGGTGYGVTVK